MNKPEEGGDVPVLTQVVEEVNPPRAPVADTAALETLARHIEDAVLERLRAQIDRVTALALERVRTELTTSVEQMVREAVAASVAQALAVPKRD
jgi:uncharacterized protein YejL (UPF0352 family)